MIDININNGTREKFTFVKEIKDVASHIIKNEKIKGDTELSLIIVADQKIRTLAKEFKNKDYVTDVLSFPNDWRELAQLIKINSLGDIYINKNKVKKQSKAYGHTFKREFMYLFAHGLLHLIGYDHQDEESESIMNKKIENVLEKMGVSK